MYFSVVLGQSTSVVMTFWRQLVVAVWHRPFRFAIPVYLVTAIFTVGFWHEDEHFQILEFAAYKLGTTPENALTWEFQDRVRPWLQPGIFFVLMAVFREIGVESPFLQATLFRIFSGVVGLVGIWAVAKVLVYWIQSENIRRATVLALLFIYFMPLLHVRTSSENFATSALCVSLLFWFHLPLARYHIMLSGVFAGLAFQFRYQIALMIVGAALWNVFYQQAEYAKFLLWSLGFLLVTAVSLWVDAWGYEQFVVAAWEYLHAHNKASQHGVSPWYAYFLWLGRDVIFPFGAFAVAILILAPVFLSRHVLTWMIAPFVVFHTLIPHKEFRYLFPVLQFIPIIGGLLYARFRCVSHLFETRVFRMFLGIALLLNSLMLLRYSTRPLQPALQAAQFLHEKHVRSFAFVGRNPFESDGGLPFYFYGFAGVRGERISFADKDQPSGSYVVVTRNRNEPSLATANTCRPVFYNEQSLLGFRTQPYSTIYWCE
jgi:phosphatidylinositol glycan class B